MTDYANVRATVVWLGTFFGAMAWVALFYQVTFFEFVPVLQLLINFYNSALAALLGWAHEPIMIALRTLGSWFDWDPHFRPEIWRNVFVLNMAIVSAFVRVQQRGVEIFYLLTVGLLVALVNSTHLSLLIDGNYGNLRNLFPIGFIAVLLMMLPILTMLGYEIGLSMLKLRTEGRPRLFGLIFFEIQIFIVRFLICLISGFAIFSGFLWLGQQLGVSEIARANPEALGPPEPAVFLFATCIVLAYAFQFLVRGPALGIAFTENQRAWRRLRSAGTWRIGWLILATFFGATIFILTNVGLKILGID